MNYLAHIFLSGDDRKLQLGNFIGDAVKGRAYENYPTPIAEGILLHRAIDQYTDSHPLTKEGVLLLKPQFKRYSGVLLDVFFDYLLASHFSEFSDLSLRQYTRGFYRTMVANRQHLPARMRSFMWHFIGTDRLGRYATLRGIEESLRIMIRVHGLDLSSERAVEHLVLHEEELLALFREFFDQLQTFSNHYILSADRPAFLAAQPQ